MTTHSTLDDYTRVSAVIASLSENWREQPSLEALAEHVHLSPEHLQRLFTRWAGISPKGFLQALTLDHARSMLQNSASILETSLEVGLSGPSRLHDLFVTHEGMSPGAWKNKGEGLTIFYGFHPSPFGLALVMATEFGMCGLAFADQGGEPAALADMTRRWPNAQYTEDSARTAPYAAQVFGDQRLRPGQPLRVTFIGTDFEIRVWETLLKIPVGPKPSVRLVLPSAKTPFPSWSPATAFSENPAHSPAIIGASPARKPFSAGSRGKWARSYPR
jgi:AraC family transcriptional regulator, regulatory protein of adaptative response / methylated-DNA-[protein]-cysteine methyltransferase